jgi:hypothetical protein
LLRTRPSDLGIRVGEADSAVVREPDAPCLHEAGVEDGVHLLDSRPPEEQGHLLLYDELKPLGSYSVGEAADY